jgi:putative endonuclease
MKHFLYILKSKKDNELYIGISQDPERRLVRHNTGKTFSTRHRRPFELIYQEVHASRELARQREKFLKSYAGVDEKRRLVNNIGE